jgi:MFS family permease
MSATAAPSRRNATFAALRVRNFRNYIISQTISQAGGWMQTIGQGWLVYRVLTDRSGFALGVVTALQTLPVLFFAPYGGVIVDRVDKVKLLMVTQVLSGVQALVLWALVATDNIELWMVYALALSLGCVLAFDNPVRQTMSVELVGPDLLTNAVTLNNVNFNVSRVVGPFLAGITIDQLGLSPCFFLNGITFGCVVLALALLRRDELHVQPRQERAKGQVRDGMRYVWSKPQLRVPVLMMFVIGTLAYETQVVLPVFATKTFGGDAGTYSLFTGAMGLGAVIVGLGFAARMNVTPRLFLRVTLLLGLVMVACGAAPNEAVAVGGLIVLGAVSVTFLAAANATLQLTTPPAMRGRVLALWSMAFMGTVPIGGPLIGWIGDHVGARWGLYVGGAGPIAAALWAWPRLARLPNGLDAMTPAEPPPTAPAR